MTSIFSPMKLARFSATRPWTTVVIWLGLITVFVVLLAALFSDALTSEFGQTDSPDSKRAKEIIESRIEGQSTVQEAVLVQSSLFTVDDDEFRLTVEEFFRDIEALGPDLFAGGTHFYVTLDESLVSEDRQSTFLPLRFVGTVTEAEKEIERVFEIVDEYDARAEFNIEITGEASFSKNFTEQASEDSERGESIGAPIALVILFIVFGTLVAAFIPMVLAIIAIIGAIALTTLVGQVYDINVLTVNVITMIGLAVGIDYTLFYISRYREEVAGGLDRTSALVAAGATAGRTVLFSGITVIVALVSMLLIPQTAFFSVGFGSISVVFVSVAAALTLLPAVLSLLGGKVDRLGLPFIKRSPVNDLSKPNFWDRVGARVMKHPVISLIVFGGLLLAASAPLLGINTGASGVSTFPEGLRARDGYVALQQEFGSALQAPIQIVVQGDLTSPDAAAALEELQTLVSSDVAMGQASISFTSGDLVVIRAPVLDDPADPAAMDAVARIREDYVPRTFTGISAEVLVGGIPAENRDFVTQANLWTPIIIGVVLALSFILLMVVFRSIVVPIKAIIMNLLSVGAAYGLLVLVFQEGVGADLLGFKEAPIIQFWIPAFLFAVLYGLSMDYHVFLLSRVKEHYDKTGDNDASVAFGLRSTGSLITGAALIMVVVFAGFTRGELVQLQQMGFGLGIAILLDATIVRSVLVPASMKLLGDKNWYLPPFLDFLPRISLEVPSDEPLVPERATS